MLTSSSHDMPTTTRSTVVVPPSGYRVLVCDHEEMDRWTLTENLQAEGFAVSACKSGDDCLGVLEHEAADAVVFNLDKPVAEASALLRRMREQGMQLPVLVLTTEAAHDAAVEAMQLGAVACVQRPFDARDLALKLKRAIETAHVADELMYLRERERARHGELVAQSATMRRVLETIRRLESVDGGTVLLTGEIGTGKAMVARAIHNLGPRRDAAFIALDCASLPEPLIESELFGHERGAFNDMRPLKRGLLELARGGTLFLDEVAALPFNTQSKLLRALESHRFRRVGGEADLPWDATIVAATDRDLAHEAARGNFRRDLFYRLAVLPIDLPPLRARVGDVPLLVSYFLDRFSKRMPARLMRVSPRAMAALDRYGWPGNVCELRNVIERMVALHHDEPELELEHLPAEIRLSGAPPSSDKNAGVVLPAGGVELLAVEKSLVVQALERTQQNQSAAAKLLGISRYALRHRLEKFGLKAPK